MQKLLDSVSETTEQRRDSAKEKLAELSGCHPTYIGQLERGEKNATLESIERITAALGITLQSCLRS